MNDSPAETLQDKPSLHPGGPRESNQPGPIYDTATRWLLIRQHGADQVSRLLGFASDLATIRLDITTIRQIVKEAGMNTKVVAEIFRDTEVGRVLHEEGRTEGREEGQQEARERLLSLLLRERFGDHPSVPAIARHLTAQPEAAALHAISAAATLDELI
jgi:hypothetical protein